MSALRRWAVVAAATAALCAVPSLAGLLPAHADRMAPPALLAKIRASGSVAYSGLVESRGSLGLPSLPRLGGLDDLLSGTTRTRVWYGGPHRLRVDRITLIGEDDTYRDSGGSWTWSSGDRVATRVSGSPALRLPAPADLLPPELGRRLLAPAGPAELRSLPSRRVAGRRTVGLRIAPSGATTVGHIDVWADPRTGLPLQVDVSSRGSGTPTLTTSFLDLALGPPPAGATDFRAPPGARIEADDAPDIVAAIDRFAPYALPGSVAGLPDRPRVSGLKGGAAIYGRGYGLIAVLPLRDRFAFALLDQLKAPPGRPVKVARGSAAAVVTPLVTTLLLVGRYQSFLLAGTVPLPTLQRAADELSRRPLPLRAGQ